MATTVHTRPAADTSSRLRVRRLSTALGAVVEGVDLNELDQPTTAELRRLITDHQVVFLPGQNLDEAAFTSFAQQFGTLSVHPLRTLIERPKAVSVIEDTPSRPPAGFPWHTDLSWLERPPRFGFLQALDIPEHGGDTMWASLTAAYRSLSPNMQALCAELSAVHQIDPSFRDSVVRLNGADVAERLDAAHPAVIHPLVRTHPDTGEPSLWLSPLYLDRILDLLPGESTLLMSHLDTLIENPNIAVRWHWTEGDIVIWDESCTVHRALVDHHPLFRRMRRCTTDGQQPVRWNRSIGGTR